MTEKTASRQVHVAGNKAVAYGGNDGTWNLHATSLVFLGPALPGENELLRGSYGSTTRASYNHLLLPVPPCGLA